MQKLIRLELCWQIFFVEIFRLFVRALKKFEAGNISKRNATQVLREFDDSHVQLIKDADDALLHFEASLQLLKRVSLNLIEDVVQIVDKYGGTKSYRKKIGPGIFELLNE